MPARNGTWYGSSWIRPERRTQHALMRLDEHHPGISVRGACELLDQSRHVPQGEISGFLQRKLQACQDEYYVAPGRAGILVLARGRNWLPTDLPWSAVTYLRLTPAQQDFAIQLWGHE